MKKFIAVFLVLFIVASLTACTDSETTPDYSSISSEISSVGSDISSTTPEISDFSQTSSDVSEVSDNISSTLSSESRKTANTSSSTSKSKQTENKKTVSQVSKPAPINTDKLPSVNKDNSSKQSTSSESDEDELNYSVYSVPTNMVNWICDGDTVYTIHNEPYCLCEMNVNDMSATVVYNLPGRPAEIQIHDNQIMISYPDLQKIIVYDKAGMTQIKEYFFTFSVSSFCFDEDTVYATEDDQWCKLYKVSLETQSVSRITEKTYLYPKILLNKEKGLLYLGESGYTGSALYYIRLSDSEIDSQYKKNNYGYENWIRSLFYVDNSIYWGAFKFSPDNAAQLSYQYKGNVTSVDSRYVITTSAIYDNPSGTPLLLLEYPITRALVTQSETLLLYNKYENLIYIFYDE